MDDASERVMSGVGSHDPDNPNCEYRCGPVVVVPLNSEFDVVYIRESDQACIMPRIETRKLTSCGEFLPLAQHAAGITAHFSPLAAPDDAMPLLEGAVASGMLIRRAQLLDRCASDGASESESRDQVEWIVVPTRARPRELLRAVRGYAANVAVFNRRLKFFISDQTESPNQQQELRAYLVELASETGVEMHLAGLNEKLNFLDALTKGSDIPVEVARFGLFGRPDANANIGANRNAALLQTAGTLFLSVDDDTVCEPASVPGGSRDVVFGGEADPTEVWFFGDRRCARGFVEPRELDFVGAHQQMLGLTLRSIAASAASSGKVDLQRLCVHLLNHLWFGTGRVLSTYNGLVGDAGVYTALPFLLHSSSSTKERLTSSSETYLSALRSREIVRQTLAPTVSHGAGAVSIATFIGLDNRALLPPFFPPFRSEDGIFGQMLADCRGESCIGHIPLVLVHDRPETRIFGDIAMVRMADLLLGALLDCPASVGDQSCADRLTRLGSHLRALGSMPEGDFREWARVAMFKRASAILVTIEMALKRSFCYPEFWASSMSEIADSVAEAVVRADHVAPHEVRGSGGLGAARHILLQFGELLHWWPSIVEKTHELAHVGVRLGCRVA